MKVKCKKCGEKLEVSDELVGQQVRCPKCEYVVEVTADETSESHSVSKDLASEQRAADSFEAATHARESESATQNIDVAHPVEGQDSAQEHVSVDEAEKLPWETAKEWYLKIPEGLDFGPTSLEQLDQWVTQGRVSAACKVRYDQEDWQAASDFYSELVEAGNPFEQKPVGTVAATSSTPARHLEPHRGTLVLSLAIAGCIVPFLSVWPAVIGTRDLRLMSLGKMDPSGNAMTRSGQAIAMVASMIWFGAFAIGLLAILIATMNGLAQ